MKFLVHASNKTRFHRFLKEKQSMKSASTDEGIKPEKVDKAEMEKGGVMRKSHLGWRISMASSLPREMPLFARQFWKPYMYDVVLVS